MSECLNYFSRALAAVKPSKLFQIPSWIPKFNNPQIQFDLDPPSYRQITIVIRKMKASGSPCPLDQISVICFVLSLERCPFLRTYLTELIRAVWLSGTVPTEWKRACTILIHKQGEASNPSNFRPITLESIPLKVFTSCLRNSVYSFLTANQYIEHNIQKGFTPNLSGTLEHTAQMANIINIARIKQRSLVITLLDLKNAFGEVHHNLIQSVDETNMYINECEEIDHDNLISKNFSGYVKRFFKESSSSLPSFNLAQCTSYFIKTFSSNTQIKHSLSLVGFLNLRLLKHHLKNTE